MRGRSGIGTNTTRENRVLAWVLLGLALLASGASTAFGLYQEIPWFDEALHGYFSFALTLVLALYAYGTLLAGRRRHEVLLVLTLAGLGVSLGVLWEMVEWAYDGLVPNNAILGKGDTMMDLAMDALGGLVAGCLAVRMLGHRKERKGART